jgi:CRP/FNR family transcriptional regulator, dissimilatory nitrate respiration regulator
MKITELLAAVPLFKNLSPEHYSELAMIVIDQEFKKGRTIFSEGDEGTGFYVVISGQVKIYKLSPEGKEQILHIFGPPEPFAEVAVFSGGNYPANCMTISPCRLFFFPRKAFVNLINKNPSLTMNMLSTLCMRLKQFSQMIESLSLKEVPGRLAVYLLSRSEEASSPSLVNLSITKTQLASLLGTIPETLSRIIKKMSTDGLINSSGSNFQILDRQRLLALAEGESKLGKG